ncbi:hypothetical protein CRE_21138 [Caenorhabditis remanei]|uniref:F-box domain-containing protein n=1 Tax=Caenorhabditis remanei TaxID=31234 RepID=E3MEY1_CAERE|nr:hypothetical protein CRE_21138 [Caenorhabditis remanei]
MPSWNHLPVEIKQHVVKKLDFMSRHSLRNTSYCDRLIVNSTSIILPRVRFGYKNGRCLILIYTGIDKFLRIEFEIQKNGTLVHKSENSWASKDTSKKLMSPSDPFPVAIQVLKSVLAHKSILINAMEWEFSLKDLDKKVQNSVIKLLGGAKFRVIEMVPTLLTWNCLVDFSESVAHDEDLKSIRRLRMYAAIKYCNPVSAYEKTQFVRGKHLYDTILDMALPSNITEKFQNCLMEHSENSPDDLLQKLMMFHKSHPVGTARELLDETLVCWSRKSECGRWVYVMDVKYEERRNAPFETIQCGLGPFCRRCSDPFDYWYYHDLPRRILNENFLDEIIINRNDTEVREILPILYAREEKEKRSILSNGVRRELEVSSWGFKRDTFSIDKKKRKKKYTEDIKKAEVVKLTPEDTICEKQDISGILQSIVTAIVFPISVSFIFYVIISLF